MLYTVAEVSEEIDLSKGSIYNILELKEIQDHIIKKYSITCIDEIALSFQLELKLIQTTLPRRLIQQ
jgi:hypothetical protein